MVNVMKPSGRPSIRPPCAEPSAPSVRASGATQMRYRMASLLRVSDGIVSRAVSAYDRMFAIDTAEKADIYLRIGQDFARAGAPDDALEALRQCLEFDPHNVEAWVEIARIRLGQQAPGAAVDALESARAVSVPRFEIHFYLAEALTDLGDHEAAVTELKHALRIEPDVPEAHYRLGVALDTLTRHEEAIGAFERAIELAPREVSYHQSLGFTLESMGDRKAAIACFKHALDLERRTALQR